MATPMTDKQARAKKQKTYFYLWVGILATASLTIIICLLTNYDPSRNNARYSQPFVHRMKPGDSLDKSYDAPGLKESSIQKRQGRGYQTY